MLNYKKRFKEEMDFFKSFGDDPYYKGDISPQINMSLKNIKTAFRNAALGIGFMISSVVSFDQDQVFVSCGLGLIAAFFVAESIFHYRLGQKQHEENTNQHLVRKEDIGAKFKKELKL